MARAPERKGKFAALTVCAGGRADGEGVGAASARLAAPLRAAARGAGDGEDGGDGSRCSLRLQRRLHFVPFLANQSTLMPREYDGAGDEGGGDRR